MNKKISFLIVYIFLQSCGFQPMLKDFDITNLNIQKINFTGKNDLNYSIRNYLNITENTASKGLIVNLESSEMTSTTIKNTSGITIEEDISIKIEMTIRDGQNNKLLTDTFTTSKRLVVTNNASSDEETKRIEKDKILKNLAQKIKFKLQLVAKQYQ